MAIKQIVIAGFGPFEYDDADPDTPAAVVTTGIIEGETVKGTQLEVDEIISSIRVKAGGSILNDNDTFQLTDTGFKLVDPTGQFEVEFTSSGLDITDTINGLFTRMTSTEISAHFPGGGSIVKIGVDDTIGFLFLEFIDGGGNPMRLLGGCYKVYDSTDATSKTTGAVQCVGGISAEKSIHSGQHLTADKNVTIGEALYAKGIRIVSQVDLAASYVLGSTFSHFLVDDGSAAGGTLVLPAATGSGRLIYLKDIGGTFDTAPVTIDCTGLDTVDGNGSFTADLFKQSLTFFDGITGQWFILNNVGF